MESSLWCVADALVYEPCLLALSLVPGLSSLLGSWWMALLGTLSSCFCVNIKLSLLQGALLGVMCLTLHPTSNARQVHRLEVSCLGGTVKFILSRLRF